MSPARRSDQNKTATAVSLQRLQQAEGADGYYIRLLPAVVTLRAGAAGDAAAALGGFLMQYPDDPLGLYFLGCALRDDHQAIAAGQAFRLVLQQWPDHAAALAALANLTAAPSTASFANSVGVPPRYVGLVGVGCSRKVGESLASLLSSDWARKRIVA